MTPPPIILQVLLTIITMTFPCFILSGSSSPYSYTGVHHFEIGATVGTITQGTKLLASGHYEWEWALGPWIKLYQVWFNSTLRGPF